MATTLVNPRLESSACAFKPGSATVITVQATFRYLHITTGDQVDVTVGNDMEPGVVDMDQAWWDATFAMATTAADALFAGEGSVATNPVTI